MRKSHFYDEFLVLLGPIISSFLACSNEEKNKPKQQMVHALVLSLWVERLPKDKHTSLMQTIVNYGRKMFKKWTPDLH
jgi:hypothetical protein